MTHSQLSKSQREILETLSRIEKLQDNAPRKKQVVLLVASALLIVVLWQTLFN